MTYPREWLASADESGTANYKVEGVEYRLGLESFEDFLKISSMLDAAFKQGKSFAAKAICSHVERALDDAERQHDL